MAVLISSTALIWWAVGFWCGVFASAVMIRKFTRV